MKNILVVDNDPITLYSIVGLLKSQSNLLRVRSADSIETALEVLEQGEVHLLITGMHLTEVDTFKLSLLVSNDHVTRIFVMTHNATSSFRSKIKQIKSVVHFDQVLDISMLSKRIFTELQISYGGQVQGITLCSMLQVFELEKRTCTLLVTAKAKSGIIYLVDGKPVAAEFGRLTGRPAALQILNWQNVMIDIDYKPMEVDQEIHTSLMTLLLESGQLMDERLSQRDNLRRENRYDCLVGVEYSIGDVTYQCYMRDLSEGGAYLETEQPVEVGQHIVMTLYSPMLEQSCSINGTVVRRDTKGLGIQFEKLVSDQKHVIHSLIESCCTPIPKPNESQ
jgi:CheY-like chemotaxis protein/Tfp pilus assembly protein PilZ